MEEDSPENVYNELRDYYNELSNEYRKTHQNYIYLNSKYQELKANNEILHNTYIDACAEEALVEAAGKYHLSELTGINDLEENVINID